MLGEGVLHHVGDGVGVAAAVVGEGGRGGDVPAPARVGGFRVDYEEAVGVGEARVGRAGEVGLGGAGALGVG